jgi:hypothetical protein
MWASPTRHPGRARMMVAKRPRHGGKAAMIGIGLMIIIIVMTIAIIIIIIIKK